MTEAEATEKMKNINAVLTQIGNETDALLAAIEELKKVAGDVTPELQAAIDEVEAHAHTIDAKVSSPEVEPPTK